VAAVAIPEANGLSRKKRAAIALWSAAGALAVGAVVAGLLAQGKADDLERTLALKPPEGEASKKKADDQRSSARTLAITSDVCSVLALSSAATGLVLWLVDGKREPEAEAARSRIRFGLGAVSAVTRF
jgi:hypothetical protein